MSNLITWDDDNNVHIKFSKIGGDERGRVSFNESFYTWMVELSLQEEKAVEANFQSLAACADHLVKRIKRQMPEVLKEGESLRVGYVFEGQKALQICHYGEFQSLGRISPLCESIVENFHKNAGWSDYIAKSLDAIFFVDIRKETISGTEWFQLDVSDGS